jgi:hypothetical protein
MIPTYDIVMFLDKNILEWQPWSGSQDIHQLGNCKILGLLDNDICVDLKGLKSSQNKF